MRVFRFIVCLAIGLSALPGLVFLAVWGFANAAGCEIAFKADTVCEVASFDLGWLVDRLVAFGVHGAITGGLAIYIFAGWVMVELAAIIFRGSRQ